MELSLLVPQEYQEAISNFLMEQGATGIVETEEITGAGLKAYFLRDGKGKKVVRALHQYLRSLERLSLQKVPFSIDTSLVPEQDWGENWKRFFRPLCVGSRFVVFPPWERPVLKRGQIPIEITPGMAFGTGTHATTQLCIQVLENRVKRKGLSVLDMGTGSGILAIVAAKLGAQEVWAIDIDEVAIEGARENTEKNGVKGIVRIRKGGIGRVRKAFDVIVANIDLKSLMRLRMPLLRHLKGDGFLILSGILREQEESIRRYYLETKVLRLLGVDHQAEWACLTLKKRKEKQRNVE
jgi:ribosomal protein L11 methyltransferase